MSDLIEPDDVVLECACGTGLLSAVTAQKCRLLTATDFSEMMLKKAEKNCTVFQNITFAKADITALAFPDCSFDKVVAGNVIHLLDNPLTALRELNCVCKGGGILIIPTYMNKDGKGKTSGFANAVGKAGADFKRQFTAESYERFFRDAGYSDVRITLADGRIPCAVAVMKKVTK
jgi:ubiquinone/menaquinone biosynthesis C-methylase UbiE